MITDLDDFDPRDDDDFYRRDELEPSVSYRRRPLRIFPTVDDDGYDREGWSWGARTYGRSW